MARRVFFSFHYEKDIWRANVVRNSWLLKPDRESAGFFDGSLWEEAKAKGDAAIKSMLDTGLRNTTVTAVLIGTETADRPYVLYEVRKSIERGNALIGVYIHNIKDSNGRTAIQGRDLFGEYKVMYNSKEAYLSWIYKSYDWVWDNGYSNFGAWVSEATQICEGL